VASIKLNKNCDIGSGLFNLTHGRLNLPCSSLRALIRIAYGDVFVGASINSRRTEALGGPGWLDTDRYSLSAKAEGKASTAEMMGIMLKTLLEDRFKVKVHKESRETPVYILTVAKSNPNLQPSKEGSCTPIDVNNLAAMVPRPGEPRPKYCGTGGSRFGGSGVGMTDWYGVTMAEFAGRMLSSQVDRPVIDKTGLTGRFDVHVEFVSDYAVSGPITLNGVPLSQAPSADPTGPTIFTALQEQLGLKLSPAKSPVEVIVVDGAEKPSDN
jgi:uncharacterized protein (TIGR03435 family)